ncbi:DUF5357 family protein [Lyngbya sp. PCC 8106]|uniref:DUF5357 family protein n=1 Tax=Lyngbya sp. (strain PCC 8106) TaxID=313612 RepID=UPI0000EA9124|nr:DUF5357 family protein [Lyngbya sp. PCC 8106]EAW36199.1 hypothetical protein L8106_20103 [Lyngbya sp. PCC 8106]
MDWKKNVDRVKTVIDPALPPKFIHWKTLLIFSIVIWVLSFIALENTKDIMAVLGWILLTVSLGWATSQPPFVFGSFILSPWIIATFISLLIYQLTQDTDPTLALKAWPLIAAVFIAVMEGFKSRSPENSPSLFSRTSLVTIILIHVLLSCWIDLYILLVQQMENNPELNPSITRPRPAFLQPASGLLHAENHLFLNSDEQF